MYWEIGAKCAAVTCRQNIFLPLFGGIPHKLSLESEGNFLGGWKFSGSRLTFSFGKWFAFSPSSQRKEKTLSKTKTLIFSPPLVKSFAVRVTRSLFCHSALGAKKVPFSPNKNATYPQPIQNPEKLPGGVTIPNTYGYGNRQSASHSDYWW